MTRACIKRKLSPKKRGAKPGIKRTLPHVCRDCKFPLSIEEAYHRKKGGIDWICKSCTAKRAYLNSWKRKGIEAVEKEVNKQKIVLMGMTELLWELKRKEIV